MPACSTASSARPPDLSIRQAALLAITPLSQVDTTMGLAATVVESGVLENTLESFPISGMDSVPMRIKVRREAIGVCWLTYYYVWKIN